MRLAFFSPLPPVKSGIADYSAALLDPLKKHAEITVFTEAPRDFQSSRFDAILYQIAIHLRGEVSGWIFQPGENLQPAFIGQRAQPDCDIHIEKFI